MVDNEQEWRDGNRVGKGGGGGNLRAGRSRMGQDQGLPLVAGICNHVAKPR